MARWSATHRFGAGYPRSLSVRYVRHLQAQDRPRAVAPSEPRRCAPAARDHSRPPARPRDDATAASSPARRTCSSRPGAPPPECHRCQHVCHADTLRPLSRSASAGISRLAVPTRSLMLVRTGAQLSAPCRIGQHPGRAGWRPLHRSENPRSLDYPADQSSAGSTLASARTPRPGPPRSANRVQSLNLIPAVGKSATCRSRLIRSSAERSVRIHPHQTQSVWFQPAPPFWVCAPDGIPRFDAIIVLCLEIHVNESSSPSHSNRRSSRPAADLFSWCRPIPQRRPYDSGRSGLGVAGPVFPVPVLGRRPRCRRPRPIPAVASAGAWPASLLRRRR